LPINADEILRWLVEEDVTDKLVWEGRLREWIRNELRPRIVG
jgi:hypothetical protein